MPEFKNPNLDGQGPRGGGSGDGSMRSFLLMFTVVLAIFFTFQYFKPAEPAPSNPQTAQKQAALPPASSSQPASSQPASNQPEESTTVAKGHGKAKAPVHANTPAITAAAETETTVENELYKIVFTNRGGAVKHWILKKYFDTAGKPLDLVQPQLADKFGLPLTLFTYDGDLSSRLNSALYQPSSTGALLAPGSLVFRYADDGLEVVKTYHFGAGYVIGVDVSVRRNGQPVRALVLWPAGLGDMEEFLPSSSTRNSLLTQSQIITSINGKDDVTSAAKVSGNATSEQPYDYAAVSDLYFAAAFLPDAPEHATLLTIHNTVDVPSDLSNPNSQKKPDPVPGMAMGDTSGVTHLRLFVGPKLTDVLKSVHAMGADGKPDGPTLESLIQYGWWGLIAKPLYLALKWIHDLMGSGAYNWGWCIIIVTVIFNLALLPTRFMMMKSSLRMMRIQPKVDALKRKYANFKINDPKRQDMNAEMMALYKQENINPYGSCLPMLVQMPLFFAYFRVLEYSVELRQAHWYWLKDLSAPDQLYILPILIIFTMFITQYITPSPGMDPMQRRMMAFIMPIFMGYFLLHYASGLALYWITGNIINLITQIGINKSSIGKEMHEISARRAEKKKGSSASQKVIQGRR